MTERNQNEASIWRHSAWLSDDGLSAEQVPRYEGDRYDYSYPYG